MLAWSVPAPVRGGLEQHFGQPEGELWSIHQTTSKLKTRLELKPGIADSVNQGGVAAHRGERWAKWIIGCADDCKLSGNSFSG
jgi:hypothetical protein